MFLKELWKYREMVINLVKRDLKSRYKNSILGFAWMLINPLLQMFVYMIVFSLIIKMQIDRFYLFIFVALVPWIFFSTCLSAGTVVILSQQDMVKKIYFPREVLPIAFTISQFVNMILSFIVIFVFVVFSGISIRPLALLCLPLVMTIEFVLALGIVLLISSLTVLFRDLEHILIIVSMIWMYLTPVIYPMDYIPKSLLKYFYLNPMTSIINAYRDILYYGRLPQMNHFLNAAILSSLFLIIGEIVFSHLKKEFGKEL